MQKLIKKIRLYMNMSQTEFAEQMKVTFATVNRWENGRALPNILAQDKIYELCKEKNVPVYDMILDKIEDEAKSIELQPGRILLYHGSKSGINGAIGPKSRKRCDFGAGFYMGTDPSQVLTLICDYDMARLYLVSVDLTELNTLDVPTNLEWAMLVAFHRGRMESVQDTDFYNKYKQMTLINDIIIGSIADDRMFYVIDNFFQGNLTDAALVNSLSALELGKQYVAVTQKACDAVKIEAEIQLSYLEKKFMQEIAEANRERGVSLAEDICRNYRREGLFFDEILANETGGRT